jgi:hypothetical protein
MDDTAWHDASSGLQAVSGPQGPMDPAAVNKLLITMHRSVFRRGNEVTEAALVVDFIVRRSFEWMQNLKTIL